MHRCVVIKRLICAAPHRFGKLFENLIVVVVYQVLAAGVQVQRQRGHAERHGGGTAVESIENVRAYPCKVRPCFVASIWLVCGWNG